ncbi:hypothetical protein PGT21_008012 [Puccinia graminis f. sp. tritici]|uniref:Uncharacterized protein n=1 Tax=Puccinia graminis f. sp. tritici TaxID=56615 RepID=A0A5B0Q5E2_PUCGR|nr:hypothetical protein PGT21_008012 [Puccinia graminis f. sp. tritici]
MTKSLQANLPSVFALHSSSQILEKAVNSILGACGKSPDTQGQNKNARRAAAAGQEDDTRVALLLSKPN